MLFSSESNFGLYLLKQENVEIPYNINVFKIDFPCKQKARNQIQDSDFYKKIGVSFILKNWFQKLCCIVVI